MTRRPAKRAAALLVLAAGLGLSSPAQAALCASPPARDLISGPFAADALFRGRVLENRGAWTRLDVARSWAGPPEGEVWVYRDESDPGVDVSFLAGREYLVLATLQGRRLTVTPCDRVRIDDRFEEIKRALGIGR